MTLAQINIAVITPEIVLLLGTFLLMAIDLFGPKSSADKPSITSTLLYVGTILLVAGVIGVIAYQFPTEHVFGFSRMFVVDQMAAVLKIAILASVGVLLVYSREYLEARKLFTGEFILLLLFATLGMMVMVSSNHFVMLYLGLEIMSLSIYAMVALNRDSATSTEAAMKYFILGALASGLLLYGMSMIYGATGSLDINTVANTIEFSRANNMLVTFGVVFVVAGLAFKLGAVPFHMWVPDVYEGAPTPMTLLIGSAPKIAAFGFIIRILSDGLGGAFKDWQGMLVILAVASLAVGNIIAIAQTNIKRMLAYSTISHMGFLLLGFLSGTAVGYAASMFYIITYALTSLAAFGFIMLLSRAGFEAENIEDFKGLNKRSPWFALLVLITMMSLAGIPPFVGFFAKLAVLEAVLAAGFVWLVVFAVLMSVIGAFYYLRIVKLMYFDDPIDAAPIESSVAARSVLSLNTLAIVLVGVLPGTGLLGLCLVAIQRSL
jgi:NADH-quinone oxidoreductase subunit N